MTTHPDCFTCLDTHHVCENHPGRPWAEITDDPEACDCGAGMPCPDCCTNGTFVPDRDMTAGQIRSARLALGLEAS